LGFIWNKQDICSDGDFACESFGKPRKNTGGFKILNVGYNQPVIHKKWKTNIHPTQKPVALYKWLLTITQSKAIKYLIHIWEVAAAALQRMKWDLILRLLN
jgi:DNA modification methylase